MLQTAEEEDEGQSCAAAGSQ